MTALAPTLQAFFTIRLTSQYGASPHTVAAYRDTWRRLLGYAAQTTRTPPARLDLSQLDADLINGFLTSLHTQRHNSIATRNARLAAVHSFLTYASRYHPEHHRPGPGDPTQAHTPKRDLLPHQRRGHRAADSPRPHNQGRTA
jgi:integrase/recombinase XerD